MPKSASDTILTIETLLLQASVFLIPSNLAYHFYIDSAYINGRLSDYLLPKLYLSDLPIIILIGIYLYKKRKGVDELVKNNQSFWGLILYLLLISLASPLPISSGWYIIKIVEYYLFAQYLIHTYSSAAFKRLLIAPLYTLIITQSITSLYQYINQKSLFGYYFMGEPNLTSIDIAKVASYRGLEVIPYGTTAHPNVLAGTMTVGILLLIACRQINYKKMTSKAANLVVTGLGFTTIVLTQSISALSGLLLGLVISKNKISNSSQLRQLTLQIWIYISITLSLLIYPVFYQLKIMIDNPSFLQRYELNHAAINMFMTNPLSGVGPNLFTANLPKYPLSQQQSYLLQPAHHGLLLILAETGLIGVFLIVYNSTKWLAKTKAHKAATSTYLPLFGLFAILLLDHYPFSLQSGQMLLTLSLVLPLLKSSS